MQPWDSWINDSTQQNGLSALSSGVSLSGPMPKESADVLNARAKARGPMPYMNLSEYEKNLLVRTTPYQQKRF
jgi:hypothetical protein